MDALYYSGIVSLIVQFLTGAFDSFVLAQPTDPTQGILKMLLWIELIVQFVEGSFYIWMVFNFNKIKNITPARYYDWVLTTPSMLFTFSIYLLYIKNREEGALENLTVLQLVKENSLVLFSILLLNTTMLAFGYLTEMRAFSTTVGTALGFAPFFLMFYLVYENFARHTTLGTKAFWAFSFVWSLYGVAALLQYKVKNIMYNILDLFSKNFFGIFLAVTLLQGA
jgi:bacteriorhodopsin